MLFSIQVIIAAVRIIIDSIDNKIAIVYKQLQTLLRQQNLLTIKKTINLNKTNKVGASLRMVN